MIQVQVRPETEARLVAAYHEWRRIVAQHQVRGLQVHDARLAATMICRWRWSYSYIERKPFQSF